MLQRTAIMMPSTTGQRTALTPDRDYDDHPSVTASLEDFEGSSAQDSPALSPPSQHSGFRSGSVDCQDSEAEQSEYELSDSAGPWSPPAWRRECNWYQQRDNLDRAARSSASPRRSRNSSREASPTFGPELILPASVALPPSPSKGRSPEPSPEPATQGADHESEAESDSDADNKLTLKPQPNYMRINFRADVHQRTDTIEAVFSWTSKSLHFFTRSWTAFLTHILTVMIIVWFWRGLVSPPTPDPGPDLVKVAGLARSFEPLIHYSETGVSQISGLQDTGVAVWDLGESVRNSPMTSGPIIVSELDQLSVSLKTLALELTRFFASVDGDVDSILIVMDWAKRELSQLLQPGHPGSGTTNGRLEAAMENTILFGHRIGGPLLSSHLTRLFGRTPSQIARETVTRTFHEFLSVLETSIAQELTHSTALFGLFEAIDRQFLNLHRAAARELNTQQTDHDADLATIWSRALGPNKEKVAKYQTNRDLLLSVRSRTLANKHVIAEHNQRLLSLQANLHTLRQRLVSPLVRSENSSLVGVKEQIDGLEGVYEYLRGVREGQRDRVLQARLAMGRHNRARVGIEGVAAGDPGEVGGIEMVKRALVAG